MKRFLNTHMLLSLNLVALAFIIAATAFAIHESKKDMRLLIEENVDRQIELMTELSTITDRNGADEIIAAIIADCPRRIEFETLLSKLGTLPYRDLILMQQLFESCGNFYAERKALMVSRLEREFKVLEDNVILLEALKPRAESTQTLASWNELVSLEQKRSDLLSEQTNIQRDIITALLSGSGISSQNVRELVSRAQELNELLSVLDKQIDALRIRITS